MSAAAPAAPTGLASRTAARLRRPGPGAADVLAAIVVVLVLAWAVVPQLFVPGSPLEGTPADSLQGPTVHHWFGTDHLGRDLFTRTVHGTRLSLQATLIAVSLGFVAGAAVGGIAGYVGGVLDDVVSRGIDTVMAIPQLLLSMAIITALGFGTVNIALAVGLASIASFARLTRGEVLRAKESVFVEAARAGGVTGGKNLIRHVLPHALGPVAALATVQLGEAVLAVAALSFLGFGPPPPTPEWGLLVSDGRDYLATAWWLTTFPGLVIIAFVLSTNRVSRLIRRNP